MSKLFIEKSEENSFSLVAENFECAGNDYRQKLGHKTLVDGVIVDKTNIIHNPDQIIKLRLHTKEKLHKFENSLHEFSSTNEIYQQEIAEEKSLDDILNKESVSNNDINDSEISYFDILKKTTLNQNISENNHIIEKLRLELQETKDKISSKSIQKEQLLKENILESLNVDNVTKQSLPQIPLLQPINDNNNNHNPVYQNKLSKIHNENIEMEAVLNGLKEMTGISHVEVLERDLNELTIKLNAGNVKSLIQIGANKRVTNIEILEGPTTTSSSQILQSILQDASKLPAPQDLRYVAFAIIASQSAADVFAQHVLALKKMCIVKTSPATPLDAVLTCSNGITAHLTAHICYSQAPTGVHLVGITSLSNDININDIEAQFKSKCFRDIMDAFHFLNNF